MPRKRRAPRFDPDPERFGYVVLIVAVGLYLLACVLPLDVQGARGGATGASWVRGGPIGLTLLLYGFLGFFLTLFWPFLLAIKPNMADFQGWLTLVREELPWLANPVWVWALWHFTRGRTRAAWITAIAAVFLAALFPLLGLRKFSAVFVMPAYWCWLGSMLWLAAAAGYGDYLTSRSLR